MLLLTNMKPLVVEDTQYRNRSKVPSHTSNKTSIVSYVCNEMKHGVGILDMCHFQHAENPRLRFMNCSKTTSSFLALANVVWPLPRNTHHSLHVPHFPSKRGSLSNVISH